MFVSVTKEDNPKDQVGDEIHAAWLKEYLLKEQQLNIERQKETMKQQEALLNITRTLLQNMKNLH